jgi:hypothetical protein
VFIFVGCAAFKATVDGVKENPEAFKTEAKFISTTAETALPGLPELAYLGIGYGMAFLRRWYKNLKRKEAIDKKIA